MGLDMFIEVRKYISKGDWNDGNLIPSPEFLRVASFAPDGLTKYGDFYGATVSLPVGYWRKANAIHAWFVDNVQDGNDDCKEYHVPYGRLRSLRAACMAVATAPAGTVEDVAKQNGLLPRAGFFFGSTNIDEWYMNDIDHTIKVIDNILEYIPEDDWSWSIYYRSSW